MEVLNKVQAVTNVYRTSGIYDVIVKVNAMTEKALVETISRDIRAINDVNSTVTMIIAER